MKRKLTVMVIALAMVLCFAIGGTLAWLHDESVTVENTFTYGDINIKLEEAYATDGDNDGKQENSYKMVPGNDIAKDPKVTVLDGSEDCWLFVKIIEGGSITIKENDQTEEKTFDDFLAYALADGWDVIEGDFDQNDSKSGNETFVIARKVEANASVNFFSVLEDDKVTVNTSVTKEMMNAIDGKNADGNEDQAELNNRPTLTFTAYAVQSANLTDQDNDNDVDAADAWAIIKSSSTGSN